MWSMDTETRIFSCATRHPLHGQERTLRFFKGVDCMHCLKRRAISIPYRTDLLSNKARCRRTCAVARASAGGREYSDQCTGSGCNRYYHNSFTRWRVYTNTITATNIAPSAELFKSMILTPMSTAAKAVAQLVEDETLTGRVAELHGEHVTLAEAPAYVDEDTGKNIETFWSLGYA